MPYIISCNGNGERVLENNPAARRCTTCGAYTHRWEDFIDNNKKIGIDFTEMVEGFDTISPRFKTLLDRLKIRDITYHPFSSGYFLIRPKRTICLDLRDSELRAQKLCLTCGRFKSFLGDTRKSRIMEGEPKILGLDMVRSIQEFGSNSYFTSSIIIGDDLAGAMKEENLRGVYYHKFPQFE